ncbi:MAG: hypothetical protein EBV06_08645 [Planctomycetia bacterium]|nr:hypothetical protein [Planctomycetia bacterium]
MSEEFDRRNLMNTGVVAGGLLLLGGLESARAAEGDAPLAGEWFNSGKLDQPCAIFQHGRILLLVNEKGDIGSGRLSAANEFTILKGWSEGLVGRIIERGKVIAWKGGGFWRRA